MARTTLSTTTDVRDRLAAVAENRHTSVSELLATMADRLEREEAMQRVTDAYQRFAETDPAGFADYLSEGQAWERATVSDGLGPAADEFPEHNR